MNRFSNFSQQELETIQLALAQLPVTDMLPQHAEVMSQMRWDLNEEVRENMRAPNTVDGSAFGARRIIRASRFVSEY
jgi:hypothetical protein